MMPGQPDPYKVDYSEKVLQQFKDIGAIASALGRAKDFSDLVIRALEHLERDPSAWGDPSYHVSKGGVVYHAAALRPLAFRYAVFEELRTTMLLDVRLLGPFK